MHGVSMFLEVECAAAIWTALAVLPGLRRVQWEVVTDVKQAPEMRRNKPKCKDLSSFLQHLTKLTQIR